jgi:AraC-like DNA-binding protein
VAVPARPTIVFEELLRLARFVEAHYRKPTARELVFTSTGLTVPEASDGHAEQRVSIDLVFELWAAAGRATRDPGLPIAFASCTKPEDLGVVGLLALTSASAGEAIERALRYQRLLSDSGLWTMHRHGDRVVLRWERAGKLWLGRRLADETVLAEFVGVARAMFSDFAPTAVSFRHAAPVDSSAHERFFRAPITWEARWPELHLPAKLLDMIPSRAQPGLAAWFLKEAERKLVTTADASVTSLVRRALDAAMADGEPTLARLATQLGQSERSLRRHLTTEGAAFRTLLDDHRKARAEDMLATGHRLTDVAFVLGFSEPSAFARAYRRWFGRAPSGDRVKGRTPTR